MNVLELDGLTIQAKGATSPIVRDANLTVGPGEVVGVVGESGSGKSMSAYAVMGILPAGVDMVGGRIKISGQELAESTKRSVHGGVAMIFQNPKGSLNPLMRVGAQVARMVRIHQPKLTKKAGEVALDLLRRVGIPGAERVFRAYPHQLSGGMCQRIGIAVALACRPQLLIADEPTTALDVTVQAQIFDLLRELVDETGCGVLLITHDLGVVAEMCDRTTVIYGGQVMEAASTVDLFDAPGHPYSRYLFEATTREVDLTADHDTVDISDRGCRFRTSCPLATQQCLDIPQLLPVSAQRSLACFHPGGF